MAGILPIRRKTQNNQLINLMLCFRRRPQQSSLRPLHCNVDYFSANFKNRTELILINKKNNFGLAIGPNIYDFSFLDIRLVGMINIDTQMHSLDL